MLKVPGRAEPAQSILPARARHGTRYTFFASVAKKEGYEQIAGVFAETADQEKSMRSVSSNSSKAGIWRLRPVIRPAGSAPRLKTCWRQPKGRTRVGRALSRLRQSSRRGGLPEIANAFKQISKVEAEHERRYLKLLSRITDGNFFKRDGKIWWQCRNCGFICEAEEAPKICPACQHPQAYFEPKKDNY